MQLWDIVLVNPILNLLIALYKGFEFVHAPGAFGFALIGMTFIIRLLLHPLTMQQLKSAKKIQALKPRLDELSKKHKDDKSKLQQAQLSLYQEAGVNPAAGCLPLLVQMPVFIALYNVFTRLLDSTADSKFISNLNQSLYWPFLHLTNLDLSFFGVNLTLKPNQWQAFGWWLLLVPVITGLLQFLQTKLMTAPTTHAAPAVAGKEIKKPEADTSQMMQQQMTIMMPLMIGVFAFSFPLGLSLYWNTFSVFGIMQQFHVNKKT